MRILVYKRTHTGDPNEKGIFGIHDCMGRVRALQFDAVIGIGGIGAGPQSFGISRKITWIGITPTKHIGISLRGPLVTFEHFILFDEAGPLFKDLAPKASERMYGDRVRYCIDHLDESKPSELHKIIEWAKQNSTTSMASKSRRYKSFKVTCVPSPSAKEIKSSCRPKMPNP